MNQENRNRLKCLTVLYVEDEEDARDQFTLFLKRIVGTLIVACDGAEGLAAYHAHHPDIIITDIQMPHMDGLTMAQKIHDLDPALPVIVITAFEQIDYLMKATVIGVEKYVAKPVQCDRLLKCLEECAELVPDKIPLELPKE